MDKKKVKKLLDEAYSVLNDCANDPNSWFAIRLKDISNTMAIDREKLHLRLELESKLLGLILEALKREETKE